ncbi:MAG: SprB repeat-containing protein, partial [Flavobacteriales bacterium]
MKKLILICSVILLGNQFVSAQVSKTNSTPLTLSSGPVSGSRTFAFTAGDFGGCSSLTEVEISITMTMGSGALDCNAAGDPYSVQEDLGLRLTSPTGTSVDILFDKWDYFEPSLGNTLSSFVTVPISTILFDDDAASLIGGDWNTFAGGSARPVEPFSTFDGQNAVGTWTLSMCDGNAQFSASDYFCITSSTLTVTCGAACTDPTVPTITASSPTVCPGNSSTLNITGTLNDATNWAIYTGSCGGTLLGTTATSSFVVTPGANTTYYIRGEGGCVTPGSCGTVTVNVSNLNLTASSQTNVACNGGSNGAAAVNAATGGAGGYTYNWTPGNPTG